jgi:hypothetical protein
MTGVNTEAPFHIMFVIRSRASKVSQSHCQEYSPALLSIVYELRDWVPPKTIASGMARRPPLLSLR